MDDRHLALARAAAQQLLLSLGADAAPDHTFGEAIERYRTEHLYVDGLARNTIAWREAALVELGRWAKRPIGGRWRDVAAVLYREAGDRGLKEATPSMRVNTLARVLNLAKRWGWRTEDHDLVGLCRVRSGKRVRVLTLAERRALETGLAMLDTPRSAVAADCARYLLHTGWRVSEAATLAWEHVAADLGSAYLPTTKSGPQTRAIGPEASRVLQARAHDGAWVFPARNPLRHIGRRAVEHAMERACVHAGIRGASLHTLRHTRATVSAQLQLPTKPVALALGHTVEQQQSYVHVELDDVRATASAIDAGMFTERRRVR